MLQFLLKANGGTAWGYLAGMIAVCIILGVISAPILKVIFVFTACCFAAWYAGRDALLGGVFESLLGGKNGGTKEPAGDNKGQGGNSQGP